MLLAFDREIAGEAVQAICPPKPRRIVRVERQHLLRQWLSHERLNRQVTIEDIENLGAVFKEIAVPDTAKSHAVPHDKIVGAMDGQPAIRTVPDRSPDNRCT